MRIQLILGCVTLLSIQGCSTIDRTRPTERIEQNPQSELQSQIRELRKELTESNFRIESLETRIDTLNAQLKAALTSKSVTSSTEKKTIEPVQSSEADRMDELDPPPSVTGYTNDEAIQNYRQALLLYKAQKYPEAVLAFSTFVERYADHPLAGNAQYYVGSSYLQQGEPKLALQELQRVLSAYDRSPMVSRALLDMAVAEEKLQNREAAAKYRQLLISLFPMSPAAGELRKGVSSSENNPPVSPLGAPVPETAPAAIPTNDKEESE